MQQPPPYLFQLLLRLRLIDISLQVVGLLKFLVSKLLEYAVKYNILLLTKIGIFLSFYIQLEINSIIDSDRNTLLHRCTNPEIAKLLCDSIKGITATNNHGQNPLHVAVVRNNLGLTTALVERFSPANVNAAVCAKNNFGQTPFYTAVALNSQALTKALLVKLTHENAFKAIGIQDSLGQTVLHKVIELGSLELFKLLLAYADATTINIKDNHGQAVLHKAMLLNRHDFVEFLLKLSDINVDIQDADGNTPLHLVKNLVMCKMLVNRGANMKITNHQHKLPIELYKYTREGDLMRLFLHKEEEKSRKPTPTFFSQARRDMAVPFAMSMLSLLGAAAFAFGYRFTHHTAPNTGLTI